MVVFLDNQLCQYGIELMFWRLSVSEMSVFYSAFTQLIALADFTALTCCNNFILLYESIAFLFK